MKCVTFSEPGANFNMRREVDHTQLNSNIKSGLYTIARLQESHEATYFCFASNTVTSKVERRKIRWVLVGVAKNEAYYIVRVVPSRSHMRFSSDQSSIRDKPRLGMEFHSCRNNMSCVSCKGPLNHLKWMLVWCIAKTLSSDNPQTLRLIVAVPPVAIDPIPDSRMDLTEGSTVAIRCHAKGKPAPRVYWQRWGVNITRNDSVIQTSSKVRPLKMGTLFVVDAELKFTRIRYTDDASYSCIFHNSGGIV